MFRHEGYGEPEMSLYLHYRQLFIHLLLLNMEKLAQLSDGRFCFLILAGLLFCLFSLYRVKVFCLHDKSS